jgi:hypothetical protein
VPELDADRLGALEDDLGGVRAVRFGRFITGCRLARAADSRRPRCTLRSNGAKPSCRYPFTSSVSW